MTSTGRDPFGLNPAEGELLNQLLSEVAAPLGLDGARIYVALREGRTLGEALGLPADLTDVLYLRAHTWFSAGRPDRAGPVFRALCALDGRCADHWVGHGVCLTLSGAEDEAEIAFATAAALRPDWAVPHFHAAGLAVSRGRWEAARAHLSAFLARRDPGLPETMLREAGRLEAAMARRSPATTVGEGR
ncbi:MAG: hypothetical protein INR63_28965 [Actinomycetospora chiangmaiensis]|nr:hypothetical protein [Actinomycetospora chiangmaiensis]